MTNQRAIQLLRMEMLGDSEQMELAKQMGASALETQKNDIAPIIFDNYKMTVLVKIRKMLEEEFNISKADQEAILDRITDILYESRN